MGNGEENAHVGKSKMLEGRGGGRRGEDRNVGWTDGRTDRQI